MIGCWEVSATMFNGGKPLNFVTCIENDKSDKDMYESILSAILTASVSSQRSLPIMLGESRAKPAFILMTLL